MLENKGIITDENYYDDTEYISASMVKQALQGSKKRFDFAMSQNIESEAFLVGSAFHAMMLEPEEYKKLYAFEPAMDRRTKAGKEYIAEWKEQNADIPNHLPGKSEDMLLNMQDSLNNHPVYKALIKESGEREVIKLFELEGEKCKAKVDYYDVEDNYIVDIKTCKNLDIEDIAKSIKDYKYGIQAAFYLDGLKAHKFYFVFIEKKAPYDAVVVEFVTGLEDSRQAYQNGIANIKTFRELDETKKEDMYLAFNNIIKL